MRREFSEKEIKDRLLKAEELWKTRQREVFEIRQKIEKILKEKKLAKRKEKYMSLDREEKALESFLEMSQKKARRAWETVEKIHTILESAIENSSLGEKSEKLTNHFFENLTKDEQKKRLRKELEDLWWKENLSRDDVLREVELRRLLSLLEKN